MAKRARPDGFEIAIAPLLSYTFIYHLSRKQSTTKKSRAKHPIQHMHNRVGLKVVPPGVD